MNIGNQPVRQLQVDSVLLVNIAREVTPQPDEAGSGMVVMLAASVQVLYIGCATGVISPI